MQNYLVCLSFEAIGASGFKLRELKGGVYVDFLIKNGFTPHCKLH